jgi:hypothetical protein
LFEKARLARSFPNVIGPFGTEALVPNGQCTLAPALPVGFDELHRHIVAHAPLSQLISNLQRALPSRGSVVDVILCEAQVGQKILGLEGIQRLANEQLGKPSLSELAPELGTRVLAARQ